MKPYLVVSSALFLLLVSASAQAHKGRTDSDGCHLDRAGDVRHCHESRDWIETAGIISRVVDGDTFIVNVDGVSLRIRLIGIDCPEPDTSNGQLIKSQLEEQITGKDALLVHQNVRDVYGRLLAEIHIDDEDLAGYIQSNLMETIRVSP